MTQYSRFAGLYYYKARKRGSAWFDYLDRLRQHCQVLDGLYSSRYLQLSSTTEFIGEKQCLLA